MGSDGGLQLDARQVQAWRGGEQLETAQSDPTRLCVLSKDLPFFLALVLRLCENNSKEAIFRGWSYRPCERHLSCKAMPILPAGRMGGAGCGAIWLLALSLFFQSCLTSTPRLDRALSPSAMSPRTRGLSVGGVVRTPSMVERESDPDDDQSLRDESERSALRQVLLRHEGSGASTAAPTSTAPPAATPGEAVPAPKAGGGPPEPPAPPPCQVIQSLDHLSWYYELDLDETGVLLPAFPHSCGAPCRWVQGRGEGVGPAASPAARTGYETRPVSTGGRDETCPVSTGGKGGGGGWCPRRAAAGADP